MEPRGLIFFDIDGTLTRGVNSGIFVAERLGIGDEMRAAEEAYARGEMDNAAVCLLMFTKNWSEWSPLFEHRGH